MHGVRKFFCIYTLWLGVKKYVTGSVFIHRNRDGDGAVSENIFPFTQKVLSPR